jgi:hypothetical protein
MTWTAAMTTYSFVLLVTLGACGGLQAVGEATHLVAAQVTVQGAQRWQDPVRQLPSKLRPFARSSL